MKNWRVIVPSLIAGLFLGGFIAFGVDHWAGLPGLFSAITSMPRNLLAILGAVSAQINWSAAPWTAVLTIAGVAVAATYYITYIRHVRKTTQRQNLVQLHQEYYADYMRRVRAHLAMAVLNGDDDRPCLRTLMMIFEKLTYLVSRKEIDEYSGFSVLGIALIRWVEATRAKLDQEQTDVKRKNFASAMDLNDRWKRRYHIQTAPLGIRAFLENEIHRCSLDFSPNPAPNQAFHEQPRIGVLAYGSLIDDPGRELCAATVNKVNVVTPFMVEFARSSAGRNGAPTLVPVEKAGSHVRAVLLKLGETLTADNASDILYRREIDAVDSGRIYNSKPSPGQDDVLVERVADFGSCDVVVYTKIAANIDPLTVDRLADLAVASAKAEAGRQRRDGISYLIATKRHGITTPFSDEYEQRVLKQTNSQNLEDAWKVCQPEIEPDRRLDG